MSVVPTKPIDRIQFYEDHSAPFTTNATAIGVTTTEVTDLDTKTDAARAAYTAQQVAQQAAKNATVALHNAVDAMSTAGAALLKKIRAKAEQTANPNVYTLAEIPPPPTPSPVGAPGEPTNFAVLLQNNGALTLTWKCANPAGASGTTYQVWRRLAATGDLAFIGVTGEKKFVDATIPAGTTQATYQIQAFRSTIAGPWAQFNVNFTTEIGGAVVTAVTAPKMAA
jgi:hypothetical protein